MLARSLQQQKVCCATQDPGGLLVVKASSHRTAIQCGCTVMLSAWGDGRQDLLKYYADFQG